MDQIFGDKPKRFLSLIEQYFWANEKPIDSENVCFYTFKPFPGDLSQKQKKSWAALQSKSLSPFQSGDQYYYVGTKGMHLWVSQKTLIGIPETAAQSSLQNGTHLVAGKQHLYEQKWQDGAMLECIVILSKSDTSAPEQKIETKRSWAMQGHLQEHIKSPQSWMLVTASIFLLATIWYSAAAITLFAQDQYASIQNQRLDPLVKGKLMQRQELEEQGKIIALLQTWQSEHGYLPESLSLIASVINPLGSWRIQEILWQENKLTLQLDTGEMDLAALVIEMESIPSIQSVAIKPYGGTDNFLLEASFDE